MINKKDDDNLKIRILKKKFTVDNFFINLQMKACKVVINALSPKDANNNKKKNSPITMDEYVAKQRQAVDDLFSGNNFMCNNMDSFMKLVNENHEAYLMERIGYGDTEFYHEFIPEESLIYDGDSREKFDIRERFIEYRKKELITRERVTELMWPVLYGDTEEERAERNKYLAEYVYCGEVLDRFFIPGMNLSMEPNLENRKIKDLDAFIYFTTNSSHLNSYSKNIGRPNFYNYANKLPVSDLLGNIIWYYLWRNMDDEAECLCALAKPHFTKVCHELQKYYGNKPDIVYDSSGKIEDEKEVERNIKYKLATGNPRLDRKDYAFLLDYIDDSIKKGLLPEDITSRLYIGRANLYHEWENYKMNEWVKLHTESLEIALGRPYRRKINYDENGKRITGDIQRWNIPNYAYSDFRKTMDNFGDKHAIDLFGKPAITGSTKDMVYGYLFMPSCLYDGGIATNNHKLPDKKKPTEELRPSISDATGGFGKYFNKHSCENTLLYEAILEKYWVPFSSLFNPRNELYSAIITREEPWIKERFPRIKTINEIGLEEVLQEFIN